MTASAQIKIGFFDQFLVIVAFHQKGLSIFQGFMKERKRGGAGMFLYFQSM